MATMKLGFPLLAAALAVGCGDSGGDNVLPTTSETGMTEDTGMTTTGMGNAFPASFRFGCVDVTQLGDQDGSAVQAQILESAWGQDIFDFKLNILIDVVERDDEAGTTVVQVRSGVGTTAADLCTEPSSESVTMMAGYDPSMSLYAVGSEPLVQCVEAVSDGDPRGGTYTMSFGAEDLIYIYAEDDDGTTFNCTEDPGKPDAVPIRAVEATFSANAAGTSWAGVLNGCLDEAEGTELCSCLGVCDEGMPDPRCTECPTGSKPLRELLGDGVGPSERCTMALGAPAFDITMEFTAAVLPAFPETCP